MTTATTDDLARTESWLGAETGLRDLPAFVWLFLAGLLLNMASGNAQAFGLPLSLDRPLLLLALVLLVLDPRTPVLRWRSVYVVMAATVGWTGWSWLATGSASETAKAFALGDRIVLPFVMFAAGPLVFCTPVRRRLLLRVMVLVGIYLGVTAVAELAHLDALVWPRAIADPGVGIGYGRARGPFLASEPMGMASGLILFMSGLVAWRSRGWWRLLAVLSGALSLVAVILSLTRSTWVAAAVALVVVGLVVPRLRRWLPAAVLGLGVLLAAVQAAFPAVYQLITDRLTTERSIYDRLNTNAAAVRIIEQQPLTGIGWGRFLEVSGDWVRQADTYPVTSTAIEVHNVFLSRAAETGVLGALGWGLAMLLGPAAVVVRRGATEEMQGWRLLTFAAVLIWLLPSLSSPNPYPFPNNLVWLVGGIAGGTWLVRPRGPGPQSS